MRSNESVTTRCYRACRTLSTISSHEPPPFVLSLDACHPRRIPSVAPSPCVGRAVGAHDGGAGAGAGAGAGMALASGGPGPVTGGRALRPRGGPSLAGWMDDHAGRVRTSEPTPAHRARDAVVRAALGGTTRPCSGGVRPAAWSDRRRRRRPLDDGGRDPRRGHRVERGRPRAGHRVGLRGDVGPRSPRRCGRGAWARCACLGVLGGRDRGPAPEPGGSPRAGPAVRRCPAFEATVTPRAGRLDPRAGGRASGGRRGPGSRTALRTASGSPPRAAAGRPA